MDEEAKEIFLYDNPIKNLRNCECLASEVYFSLWVIAHEKPVSKDSGFFCACCPFAAPLVIDFASIPRGVF
jgi:hypothetical protein